VVDSREHPDDDLGAYALGALEDPEALRVESHVATCARCQSVLAQHRAVAEALPLGFEPVAPPPEALAAIRAEIGQRRLPPPQPARTGTRPLWRRAGWPALTALVASLLVWNIVLQRELRHRSPGPAPGPEVEALSRRPGRVVTFAGTGRPGASARLFVPVDGGQGHLAISGLSALPRGRTYQLWFVRTGSPTVTGGTFAVDARGVAWAKITIPPSLHDVRAISVTEEPAPGTARPTGDGLVEGKP
jgi:anti-sigma factor RsiW